MNEKTFKYSVYTVLTLLILLFFTKDIDFFYKNIKTIKNPDDIVVLVNKLNKLDKDYIPIDLEEISLQYANDNKYLRKEAKVSFEKLSSEAKLNNYKIIVVSAYRSYNYQTELFNNYVKDKGEKYTLDCSAKPGHSEHQTGLSIDVMGSNNDYDEFENSPEFEWMINNSYKYGFILRYPKNKVHITGFKYEPWHYRYVGVEVATKIHNEKITLEEYYNKYIK